MLVAGDTATKVGLFVLYAVIGRTLGRGGFGDYTLAISLAFFVRASELGIDVILSREIARDPKNVHGLFWDTIVFKLGAGIPVLAVVTGFAAAAGYSTGLVVTVALIGASNLVDVIAQSFQSVLRGLEEMGPPARASALESLSVVCMGALSLVAFRGTLVALGVAYVIAAMIALAYIWAVVRRRGIRPRRRGDTRGFAWLGKAAVPTGMTSLFGYILGRIDTVILSAMTGSSAVVGLYGGAYRIFEATLFVSWALAYAVYPLLSRLPRRGSELRRTFEISCMATAGLTVPLGGAMVLFGPVIVESVFGAGFHGSGTAVRILGGAAGIYGIFTVAAMTLAAQDRQQAFPAIIATVLAVNVTLNILLIPVLSLNGAAIAMTAAQVLLTLLMMAFAIRETGPVSAFRIFAAVLAGLAAMAGVALVFGGGAAALGASLIVYAIVFVAVEWTCHRADLIFFVSALRTRGQSQHGVAATAFSDTVAHPAAPTIDRT